MKHKNKAAQFSKYKARFTEDAKRDADQHIHPELLAFINTWSSDEGGSVGALPSSTA